MWSDYLERPLVDLDCRNAVFRKQGEVAILVRKAQIARSAPMFHPLRAVPSDDKILYALASLVSLRPRDRESLGV